ncbi:MAG: endonuclease/exonuclease/phosphatase family protein [Planctomycetes bacterium]|nr:endonuclease/exonuclease/phosphatase family protein [Planctomycetota bacterium]
METPGQPSPEPPRRRSVRARRQRPATVLAEGGPECLDHRLGVRLISWNLAKAPGTRRELEHHVQSADLVCLQEAMPSLLPDVPGSVHFAESFRRLRPNAEFHGVATLARAQARHGDHATIASRWREGWIVTPKMALATEYELGDELLLVVNVHAMNFQPVFKYMLRDQFERIAQRIAAHAGPAIVCGDFNTWRADRLRLIENLLHGFEPVVFGESEHRKRGHWVSSLAFGNRELPLDHVYVRGLDWREAQVLPSEHSDHGALAVHLFPKPGQEGSQGTHASGPHPML